jgi:glyoxylase-like metal-dependent hydrolase (beta-lactamase superfamily II)
MKRIALVALCVAALALVAWFAGEAPSKPGEWKEVAPGVWRCGGSPAGHALVSGKKALLIDAPTLPDGLKAKGITPSLVLLTHHHRDTVAAVPKLLEAKVPIRAPALSADWLSEKGVEKYWKEQFPLRNSRTAYLVVTEPLPGVRCDIKDGDVIKWEGLEIKAVATPGHSFDHFSYFVALEGGRRVVFAGDALAGAGKLWSPYTTDWDHWTDAGLQPTAASLRKLAALKPQLVLPAHGEPIGREVKSRDAVRALETTAKDVDEAAFLKSYDRYTRERRKDPPKYAFLAKSQAGSNGSKPWSKLSAHLWFTGNTYVLVSKDGPLLVMDPWTPHSEKQIEKLIKDEKLGRPEVFLCSHAHYDHYDGAYHFLAKDKPQVWTLDRVAPPVADPLRLRAPFIDARPLKFTKTPKEGETLKWREYAFKFHFLPGQSLYTMGVETTIDGKRCLFTGDNFFHHELYSGTGGWMGLNRSGPGTYEQSAKKVLGLAPDWVLAEHGSAMEFNADDFRRRVEWARVSGRSADGLCVSGKHQHDWSPHGTHIEPLLQNVKAGAKAEGELVVENALPKARKVRVELVGTGAAWDVDVGPGATVRKKVTWPVGDRKGRRVWALSAREGGNVEPGDAFAAADVE